MRARPIYLAMSMVLLAGLIVFKLVELQLYDGNLWNTEALKARTRAETIAFERGALLDRDGHVLADSESTYDLLFVYGRLRGAALGQLTLLHYLLFQDKPTLSDVRAHPERFVDAICATRAATIATLQPRDRCKDAILHLNQLARPAARQREFGALLRAAAARGETVGRAFADLRTQALARLAEEFERLERLGALLGEDELLAELDAEIGRIDALVRNELSSTTEVVRDAFTAERLLHKDLDNRLDRVISLGVSYAVVDEVALNPDRYPGFEIREAHRRRYPAPYTDLAPQLVGLVGAPDPERLKQTDRDEHRLELLSLREDKSADEIDEMLELEAAVRERDYRAHEEQGQEGLERTFESLLRGRRGYRKVERDISGQGVMTIEELPPVAGHDVRLTIDAELQLACEDLLAHAPDHLPGAQIESGALVIINPAGEVLAAASMPSLERGRYRNELTREAEGRGPPRGGAVYHRAFAPKYPPPPGSVFKPFVAVAGLEAGVLDEQLTVFCDYGIGEKRTRMACLGRHENVALEMAMAKSCNAYFGHAGELLGDQRLRAVATLFGFGQKTGFVTNGLGALNLDVNTQALGFYEARTPFGGQNETVQALRRFGCGQSTFDDVTPMQVARAMAGLATGELPQLRVVLAVDDMLVPVPPPTTLAVQKEVLDTVRRTLAGVVGPEGTARPQGDHDLRRLGLVGKSGTAEVAKRVLPDHAWFAGYFPKEKPSLVVVLLLEHASFGDRSVHGGEAAVPLLDRLFADPRAARYLGTRP